MSAEIVRLRLPGSDDDTGALPTDASDSADMAAGEGLRTTLRLEQIHVGERLRAIDEARVARLMHSIEVVGVLQPVVVGPLLRSGKYRGKHRLAAGRHRVEACRRLGRDTIEATVRDGDADMLRAIELEENLARHELSALDRATFLLELKLLWERVYPHTKHGGNQGESGRFSPCDHDDQHGERVRFTAEAAANFGFSEITIRRDVRMANKLDPRTRKRLSGTAWAHDRRLLTALAKLSGDRQVEAIRLMEAGRDPIDARNLACGVPESQLPKPGARVITARPEVALLERLTELESAALTWLLGQIKARDLCGRTPYAITERVQP